MGTAMEGSSPPGKSVRAMRSFAAALALPGRKEGMGEGGRGGRVRLVVVRGGRVVEEEERVAFT
jgi:hypothetical protein